MKIALFALNASWSHAALSVRCLADALRAADLCDVRVIEGNLRDRTRSLLELLYNENADVYGFSCYIWNVTEQLALAQSLHALRPAARIVLGGPEVSFATERYENLTYIDHIITGEGEVALPALVRALERGEQPPRVIAGTPDPNFTARGIHYGADTAQTLVYYESARGCPFSCAFCLSSASSGVRAKSAADTLDDLLEFERIPHPVTVKLVDRTFNASPARAKAIWQGLLDKRYTKCYHFEVCADLLDEESFALLACFPAGKVRLEIGLQSTNARTLAAIGRRQTPSAVLAAAKRLMQAGNLHVHLDLIAGLPHEDYASFARSFDAAYDACHVLQLGFLKLLHGTRLRRDADKHGIVFEQEPPYTVLKTAALSFEELSRLHAISDLTERLRDSGRFPHTLAFFRTVIDSPFAFYEQLTDHIARADGRELHRIGQRDLFLLLSLFGKAILPEARHAALSEALRADFALSEARKPPKEL